MESSGPSRDTAWAMSQENVDVVRQLLEAWNRGDLEGTVDHLAPEVEFRTAGIFPDLEPTYWGHAGFRQFWNTFREGWESLPVQFERMEAIGDHRVLALLRFHARGRDGVEVKRQYAQLMTLEDGMVRQMVGFADHNEDLEAAGLSE